jgi:hypothetical protein
MCDDNKYFGNSFNISELSLRLTNPSRKRFKKSNRIVPCPACSALVSLLVHPSSDGTMKTVGQDVYLTNHIGNVRLEGSTRTRIRYERSSTFCTGFTCMAGLCHWRICSLFRLHSAARTPRPCDSSARVRKCAAPLQYVYLTAYAQLELRHWSSSLAGV